MMGQLSLFESVENIDRSFKPLEALALHGTGTAGGMSRVKEYFAENHTISEKALFLKNEYGLYGFGSCAKKPCYIHSMDTFVQGNKGLRFAYYDEDMKEIKNSCTWKQLAEIITDMISKGIYIKERLHGQQSKN